MGIIIDPDQRHEFEHSGCTFYLTALTGRQVLQLTTTLAGIEENTDGIYPVLHQALKDWTGVIDKDGAALEVTADNIDALPVAVAVAVFTKVTELSGLSEDDSGN